MCNWRKLTLVSRSADGSSSRTDTFPEVEPEVPTSRTGSSRKSDRHVAGSSASRAGGTRVGSIDTRSNDWRARTVLANAVSQHGRLVRGTARAE
ncbi:hypothetical protein EL22_00545 [Halostagnicola sp. A56]|nr:hypothetical protein EL22_00545 [Halostagnicola sp. A56]